MIVVTASDFIIGENELYAARHGAELRETSIRRYGITPSTPEYFGANQKYLRFRVNPIPERAAFIQWMEWFNIQQLSVEKTDIPILVPSKIVAFGLTENWQTVAPALSQLQPDELYEQLEAVALRVMTAKPVEATDTNTAFVRSQQIKETLEGMERAGILPPDPWNNARDRHNEAVANARAAAEERAHRIFSGEEEGNTDYVEHPYRDSVGDF